MSAAQERHVSVVEALLADDRVDKASIDHASVDGMTTLMLACARNQASVVESLVRNRYTNFDTIAQLLASDSKSTRHETTHSESVLYTELTRRQMCVIFPSCNRLLHPVPCTWSNDSATPSDRDHAVSALISSLFNSSVFDVNVLRIIRQYAAWS
jgi:hypothetical protein